MHLTYLYPFCLWALRRPARLTRETAQTLKGKCALENHMQEMLELQRDWDTATDLLAITPGFTQQTWQACFTG